MKNQPCAIWWLRRDLRLADNPALQAAVDSGHSLLPLFILDEALLNTGKARTAFLFAALRSLDAALKIRGSGLIIRRGRPQQVLLELTGQIDVHAVYACEDYSPYATHRDGETMRILPVPFHVFPDVTIHHPTNILKADRTPYTIFTPYSRAWKKYPLHITLQTSLPERLPPLPAVDSLPVPQSTAPPDFPACEDEAQRRLQSFVQNGLVSYHIQRDRLDMEGTSFLSPYFRFGLLSARRAAPAAMQAARNNVSPELQPGSAAWLNELIWRDFYSAILYHYPYVLHSAFRPAMRHIAWRDAPAELQAWQKGETGYPVVDAAMRQLNNSGWMHNRGRMICASFLVKDLLIDWQLGEQWFMQQLVDGDPPANNGGWQWSAGVGTDAAPYFRIFNPVTQSKKFDSDGKYIRRWIPELAGVPLKYIHQPWHMPDDVQHACGCIIDKHYPAPLVDHGEARQRTLDAYRAAQNRL